MGELLRVTGKDDVIRIYEYLIPSIWSLQVYVGHDTGNQSVINATYSVYEDKESEAVVLVDGSSPFNHVNKVAFPLDFFRFLTVPYRTFTNLVSLKPWLALVILKLALHRPIRNVIKNVNND